MSEQEWDSWYDLGGKLHKGCKARFSRTLKEDLWIHVLISPPDEPNPRQNHIHIKYYNSVSSTPVLCGVTDGGRKSHSRKRLIERINEVTGLALEYK